MLCMRLVPSKDMIKIAKSAFPKYRRRTYTLSESYQPINVTGYWDGLSSSSYVAMNLTTGEVLPMPQNGTPFDGKFGAIAPYCATKRYTYGVIPPHGFVIVEHAIRRGKDRGITFHVSEYNHSMGDWGGPLPCPLLTSVV